MRAAGSWLLQEFSSTLNDYHQPGLMECLVRVHTRFLTQIQTFLRTLKDLRTVFHGHITEKFCDIILHCMYKKLMALNFG